MRISGERRKFCREGSLNVLWAAAAGAVVVLFLVFLFGKSGAGPFAGWHGFFGNVGGIFSKTLGDIFQKRSAEPALKLNASRDVASSTAGKSFSKKLSGKVAKNSAGSISGKAKQSGKSEPAAPENPPAKAAEENPPAVVSNLPSAPPKNFSECDFAAGGQPTREVLLNEIAWMGSADSANNEWLELKNNSGNDVPLFGWQILNRDKSFKIIFGEKDFLPAGKFFLLERTDDNSVPGITADKIYSGALSNSGEHLKIFDADCRTADEVDASGGWPAGDNSTKQTMERNKFNLGWQTSAAAGGTPKKENSDGVSSPQNNLQQNSSITIRIQQSSSTASSTQQTQPTQTSGYPVISEIMAGAENNSSYEFVELYNPSANEIDLTGWIVKKKTSSGSESSLVAASRLQGKKIPPYKHFLLANEAVSSTLSNANVYWPKSYALAYASNSVALYDASGSKIDEVIWSEIKAGSSYERQPLNGSQFVIELSPNPQNSSE